MYKPALILLLSLMAIAVYGQERLDWVQHAAVPVEGLQQLGVDNRGQIFYADRTGGLYQLDVQGRIINHFSWERRGDFTQLDADRTVNIFAFSEPLQEFLIFDRFLNPIASSKIDGQQIGFAQSATLGNNQVLWIFDESNLALVKFDYRRQQVLQQQPLGLVLGKESLQVKEIREFSNFLYLRSQDTVYVFDNQGNYLQSLPYSEDAKLAFFRNDLWYVQGEGLIRLSVSSGKTTRYALPEGVKGMQVQLQGKTLVFYKNTSLMIFANPF